jgi:hypothetical protein
VLALLQYGLDSLLRLPMVDPTTLQDVAGKVIVWAPDSDDRLGSVLRDWLLSDARFGDPRLPANQSKWSTMSKPARERMTRWLAKGDLLFFFDFVMPAHKNPQGRKDFWLQYIDQVVDSAVALSPIDAHRLQLSVTEKLRYAKADSPSDDVSAFIMRFRGNEEFVVAEFSQSGNAGFFHPAEFFDASLGGMRSRRYEVSTGPRGLKRPNNAILRYVHIGDWQGKMEYALRYLGVSRYRTSY